MSVDTGVILHRALTQETWRDASLFPVVWHGDLINQLAGLEVFFAVPDTTSDDDEERRFYLPCMLREEPPDLPRPPCRLRRRVCL